MNENSFFVEHICHSVPDCSRKPHELVLRLDSQILAYRTLSPSPCLPQLSLERSPEVSQFGRGAIVCELNRSSLILGTGSNNGTLPYYS